jgi:hypothetical protein
MDGKTKNTTYRLVPVGQSSPAAVTVGVEITSDDTLKAAVWWESKGDVDADEAEYDNVIAALAAAEAARALHGFDEVVVVLSRPELWDEAWGKLQVPPVAREPMGDMQEADLTSDEAFDLAQEIEAERDA